MYAQIVESAGQWFEQDKTQYIEIWGGIFRGSATGSSEERPRGALRITGPWRDFLSRATSSAGGVGFQFVRTAHLKGSTFFDRKVQTSP